MELCRPRDLWMAFPNDSCLFIKAPAINFNTLISNLDIFITLCLSLFSSYGFDMVVFGLAHYFVSTPSTNTAGKHLYLSISTVYLSMSTNRGGRWISATFWGMLRLQSKRKDHRKYTHWEIEGGLKKTASQSLMLVPVQLCQALLLDTSSV